MLEVSITAFKQVLEFEQGQPVTDATHVVSNVTDENVPTDPVMTAD